MKNILNYLFSSESEPAVEDGYTQSQREAVIDVLVYGMYADNHLSLNEDRLIKSKIEKMNWDSSESAEFYLDRTVARVRDVRRSEVARTNFFSSIGERLASPEMKRKAFELCKSLMISDGECNAKENAFLEEVSAYLQA